MRTYGISSGKTSAMMLMESVFALDVGAAASRIFNRAIMYCGKLGSMACRNKVKKNALISGTLQPRGTRVLYASNYETANQY